jgi:Glycosyl hydrolase family 71
MEITITAGAPATGNGSTAVVPIPARAAGDYIQFIVWGALNIVWPTSQASAYTKLIDVAGVGEIHQKYVTNTVTSGGTINLTFDASGPYTVVAQIVSGAAEAPTAATLPFDPAAISGGPSVMPHYFTQFPLRLTTTPAGTATSPGNYYQNYLAPGTIEGGTDHRRYGGFVRDYPIQEGLSSTSVSGWEQRDMEQEVRDALTAGCTGFTLDLLSIRGYDGAPDMVGHWTRVKRMVKAVEAVNAADGTSFTLMLMPDGTAGSTAWVKNGTTPDVNASADALADALSQVLTSSAMHKINGTVTIGPFGPEKWPSGSTGVSAADRVTFWSRLRDTLSTTYGISVLYWFCYVDSWTTTAPQFDALAYGHGRWGDRDTNAVSGSGTGNRGAAAYCHSTFNKPWMHFGGTPMDTRPNAAGTSGLSYRTWESRGFETFENSWLAAIDGYVAGDMNQIPTWNDQSEHAHICRTRNLGDTLLDLTAYFAERYRTGVWPVIKRDALYLAHRPHRRDATFTGANQVAFATIAGSTPWADLVDVLVFATSAGTVEILCDGAVIASQAVSAGRSHVQCPLPSGGVLSARLRRSGATVAGTLVTSDQPVKSSIAFDDYHYRAYSSLRQQ